jgi:hypothetical protein
MLDGHACGVDGREKERLGRVERRAREKIRRVSMTRNFLRVLWLLSAPFSEQRWSAVGAPASVAWLLMLFFAALSVPVFQKNQDFS